MLQTIYHCCFFSTEQKKQTVPLWKIVSFVGKQNTASCSIAEESDTIHIQRIHTNLPPAVVAAMLNL